MSPGIEGGRVLCTREMIGLFWENNYGRRLLLMNNRSVSEHFACQVIAYTLQSRSLCHWLFMFTRMQNPVSVGLLTQQERTWVSVLRSRIHHTNTPPPPPPPLPCKEPIMKRGQVENS